MRKKAAFLFSFLILFTTVLFSQNVDSVKVVKPGAVLILVSKGFGFAEGPAVDKAGNVYFTDQPNDKIWKYDVNGKLSVFMDKTGRSNGLYFDGKGRLISCADKDNQLWAIDVKNRKPEVLLTDFDGRHFNGPNDLWVDKTGGVYFTDPYYQRDYWTRKQSELKGQFVYYLPKGKHEAIIVDSTMLQPNGIVGTPDNKQLFVADIRGGKTYKYTIEADGRLSNKQLFISQGSDGMTLDAEGNLYLTGKGITVYNKEGAKLEHIAVPADWVGNLCFGGKDRNILFITASESVYTLQMKVKGVE